MEIKSVKVTFYLGVERDGREAKYYFCPFYASELQLILSHYKRICPFCQFQQFQPLDASEIIQFTDN